MLLFLVFGFLVFCCLKHLQNGEISKSICGEYGHDNVASSLHLLSGDWCWLSSGPLYLLPRSTPTPPAPGPVSWPQGELSSALLAAVPIAQVTPHDPCLSCWLVAGWAELLIDFYLIFTQIVKYFTLDIYWLSLVVDKHPPSCLYFEAISTLEMRRYPHVDMVRLKVQYYGCKDQRCNESKISLHRHSTYKHSFI